MGENSPSDEPESVAAPLSTPGCRGMLLVATSDVPFVTSSSQAARRTVSRHNLHLIGLGAHNYHDDYESFPPGGLFTDDGRPLHSWQTALLPYVDHAPLYNQLDLTLPWNDPANAESFRSRLNVFENPGVRPERDGEDVFTDDAGFALSHYAANERLFRPNSAMTIGAITDGTSDTILAGEVAAGFKPWGDPVNWRDPAPGVNRFPNGFGSPYAGGAHFLFADGSVHFVSETIDDELLRALSTPAGGEEVEDF